MPSNQARHKVCPKVLLIADSQILGRIGEEWRAAELLVDCEAKSVERPNGERYYLQQLYPHFYNDPILQVI